MSGGTALMLMMKAGVLRPKRLVNLRRSASMASSSARKASCASVR